MEPEANAAKSACMTYENGELCTNVVRTYFNLILHKSLLTLLLTSLQNKRTDLECPFMVQPLTVLILLQL
jgi:hypothetical protein